MEQATYKRTASNVVQVQAHFHTSQVPNMHINPAVVRAVFGKSRLEEKMKRCFVHKVLCNAYTKLLGANAHI